jgi:hypothetical protein
MPEGKAVEKGEVIETTVSEAAAELARHGLDAHDRITITIEPDELIPVRLRNWLSEILAAAPNRNTGGGGRSPAFRDRLGAAEYFPRMRHFFAAPDTRYGSRGRGRGTPASARLGRRGPVALDGDLTCPLPHRVCVVPRLHPQQHFHINAKRLLDP